MTSYPMPKPNPVMTVLLSVLGSSRGHVELDAETLRVRLGAGFQAEVPRNAITAAVRDTRREISIGAHGWRGRWLVNTSTHGLVRLTIEPPGKGRCLGLPVTLRELRVSLADPDAFLRDLGLNT